MLKLFTYWRSSTAYRVRIAMNLKGLAYEPVYVSIPKMEHKAQPYLAVNPQGLVPALVEDGKVVAQSLAILEYLEERTPQPALLPEGRHERAYVRALTQIVGCEIHPLNNVRVLKYLEQRLKVSADMRRFSCPLDAYPRTMEIASRCERLGPFIRAFPDTQEDAVVS